MDVTICFLKTVIFSYIEYMCYYFHPYKMLLMFEFTRVLFYCCNMFFTDTETKISSMGISILFIPLSVILCQGVTYGTVTLTFNKLFETIKYILTNEVLFWDYLNILADELLAFSDCPSLIFKNHSSVFRFSFVYRRKIHTYKNCKSCICPSTKEIK